jgi:hypothetical protein
MALPTEILLQLIQEAAYILPISEVLRARFVSSKSSYSAVDGREKNEGKKDYQRGCQRVH